MTTLAIAWVLKYQHTSSALFGARNINQLTHCLKSIEVYKKLTPEIEGRINKILGTHPPARMDFRKFAPGPHIRPLAEWSLSKFVLNNKFDLACKKVVWIKSKIIGKTKNALFKHWVW